MKIKIIYINVIFKKNRYLNINRLFHKFEMATSAVYLLINQLVKTIDGEVNETGLIQEIKEIRDCKHVEVIHVLYYKFMLEQVILSGLKEQIGEMKGHKYAVFKEALDIVSIAIRENPGKYDVFNIRVLRMILTDRFKDYPFLPVQILKKLYELKSKFDPLFEKRDLYEWKTGEEKLKSLDNIKILLDKLYLL